MRPHTTGKRRPPQHRPVRFRPQRRRKRCSLDLRCCCFQPAPWCGRPDPGDKGLQHRPDSPRQCNCPMAYVYAITALSSLIIGYYCIALHAGDPARQSGATRSCPSEGRTSDALDHALVMFGSLLRVIVLRACPSLSPSAWRPWPPGMMMLPGNHRGGRPEDGHRPRQLLPAGDPFFILAGT